MTHAAKLREAKALIEDPARWCQGELARDKHGKGIRANDRRAKQWCADGAVCKALRLDVGRELRPLENLLDQAAQFHGFNSFVALNDVRDHPTVMKMFDRAIELAEQSDGK